MSQEPAHNRHDTESGSASRFTLRTLLAAVWVVAVLTLTLQRDFFAVLLAGLPAAYLGFVLIAGMPWTKWQRRVSLGWAAFGLFMCYGCPRIVCPIDVPDTATNLYASVNFGLPHGCLDQARFDAPVADCEK